MESYQEFFVWLQLEDHLDRLRAISEETMQDDVTAVKKSRAASPAPKASKGKDEKEVANGTSPSAEKPPKVEKSGEPVKTDKVKKLQLHFGKRAAIGVAGLTAFFCVGSAPLNFTLTSSYMIGGITLVGVALTAVAAVAVKKFNLKLPTRGKKQS
eukprot:Skav201677  [mRNA]  locus=scaffold641:419099:420381:+ [translate_table: standard]